MARWTVVADPIVALTGQDPLRLTSDPAGQALVLAVAGVDPAGWSPSLLRMRTNQPLRYTVTAVAGPGADPVVHDLGAHDERFTDVQRLPGDRWLLARGRAAGPLDPNATVLAPDGTVERRFHVGDGIAELQADAAGNLWAGYYDEGVFGASPPGDAGLVGFDPAGRVRFRFNDQPGVFPIDACYALNVAGPDDAWLYYYSAFHLARVGLGGVRSTCDFLPVRGFSAFATDGRHLLVAGAYGDEGACTMVDLATGEAGAVAIQAPDGTQLAPGLAHGRGRLLFFRDRATWWRVDLGAI